MSDQISTLHEMRRAGYKFLAHSKCKSCHADIEWWQTNNGKKIPFDPMPKSDDAQTTTHFATCPDTDRHRKPKESKESREPKPPELPGKKLGYPRRLELLREYSDAVVIAAVWADGTSFATSRAGIDPEEVRHDLITVANNMRNHLREKNEEAHA